MTEEKKGNGNGKVWPIEVDGNKTMKDLSAQIVNATGERYGYVLLVVPEDKRNHVHMASNLHERVVLDAFMQGAMRIMTTGSRDAEHFTVPDLGKDQAEGGEKP